MTANLVIWKWKSDLADPASRRKRKIMVGQAAEAILHDAGEFDIEGRGCVVAPGVLLDSEAGVKIGDHLYITYDGTAASTLLFDGSQ